ncbi:hypothetical protein [Methanimicrococcus blatticola]|uniref:TM2 domain-containing protein n=1 Tax=Methanimicrococcus blatticola TaxID=91560 RepID=A0A484F569_9EURY|nr:hypothetical protein [Methanimicrococcus blatticola]MBZ3935270.1 hypothetical protein [Methanimicrococcus blatticola]MCC2508632.1 hypothetical protein [Methanimicrococcus blatticola]TDQ67937.1 hypothetical protein C7391_1491 [Methanimicrococcus blatticola]
MANQVIAVVLSSIIPGMGQFYSGHFLRSLLIFAVITVLVAIGWVLYVPFVMPLFFIVAAFLFWLWNIYDAYQLNDNTSTRKSGTRSASRSVIDRRSNN